MKVIALRRFKDLKEKTLRSEGDIFEVDPDRYAEIMAYRTDLIQPYGEEPPQDPDGGEDEVEPPQDPDGGEDEPKEEAKPKRKTSKAKTA